MSERGGIATGVVLAIIGIWLILRTVVHDDQGQNLVDKILGANGDSPELAGGTTAASTGGGSDVAADSTGLGAVADWIRDLRRVLALPVRPRARSERQDGSQAAGGPQRGTSTATTTPPSQRPHGGRRRRANGGS
jgi:hypothetical protein